MEQIFDAFGIDWRLIAIQVFNFTFLAVLLWYFLYNPILNILNERKNKIAEGVADAEKAATARANAESEKKEVLNEAHKEAEAVASRAKVSADEKAVEIIKTAETKAESVLKTAELQSQQLKADTLKESESEIAKLAILAAEKVLREKNS